MAETREQMGARNIFLSAAPAARAVGPPPPRPRVYYYAYTADLDTITVTVHIPFTCTEKGALGTRPSRPLAPPLCATVQACYTYSDRCQSVNEG